MSLHNTSLDKDGLSYTILKEGVYNFFAYNVIDFRLAHFHQQNCENGLQSFANISKSKYYGKIAPCVDRLLVINSMSANK